MACTRYANNIKLNIVRIDDMMEWGDSWADYLLSNGEKRSAAEE